MTITKQSLIQLVKSAFEGEKVNGTKIKDLTRGLSQGINMFLPSITISTTHTGIAGSGTGTGKVRLNSSSGIPLLKETLVANGIKGVGAGKIAKGVVQGVKREFEANGIVQVTISGTATGTGTGKMTGMNVPALSSLLKRGFRGNDISGSAVPKLSKGLAQGLIKWFQTGTVSTQDVGTPVVPPIPSTGTGTGKIT
jgi:hypothetical protein